MCTDAPAPVSAEMKLFTLVAKPGTRSAVLTLVGNRLTHAARLFSLLWTCLVAVGVLAPPVSVAFTVWSPAASKRVAKVLPLPAAGFPPLLQPMVPLGLPSGRKVMVSFG